MKLSLTIPSNRSSLSSYAKLLNFCSLASDDVEVLIRDNSGNEKKRELLRYVGGLCHLNCKIFIADPCAAWENNFKITNEVTGDFVLSACDDDLVNEHALPAICEAINKHRDDPSVIGITGQYMIEMPDRCAVIAYPSIDKPSALERGKAYIHDGLPSVLQFSAVKRNTYVSLLEYIRSMPMQASYGDQLYSLLLTLSGRIVSIERIMYQYNMVNWSSDEKGLHEDAKYYIYAGIDPSAVRLHWLFGAFEGAKSVISKYAGIGHVPVAEREEVAIYWVTQRMIYFRRWYQRSFADAKFDAEAKVLADKWRVKSSIHFDELLNDLATFVGLSSSELGQRYYDFWK
jgi:hypothetical protein